MCVAQEHLSGQACKNELHVVVVPVPELLDDSQRVGILSFVGRDERIVSIGVLGNPMRRPNFQHVRMLLQNATHPLWNDVVTFQPDSELVDGPHGTTSPSSR